MESLLWASIAFVGSHFILSHPLRRPLVAMAGERGFLGIYALVALATLVWMVIAYRAAPATAPLWMVGDGLWAVSTAIMFVASILLVGSLIGNPALPDPTGRTPERVPAPRGVFAITRHPMMWAFALWAIAHVLIFPMQANIILCAAILILALVGAALQDRKKARLQPDFWPRWRRITSFWPFAATASGNAQLAAAWPGVVPTLGGIALWLAATWAHIPLAGWEAGIWRWVG